MDTKRWKVMLAADDYGSFTRVGEELGYTQSGITQMMKALEKNHCRWDDDEQSILMNCTGMYSDGRNMPFIYGDYFFTEAMYKLRGNEILFW